MTQYFATCNMKGVILSVTDATPPQELKINQFELTKEEYDLLALLGAKFSIGEVNRLIDSLTSKIAHMNRSGLDDTSQQSE